MRAAEQSSASRGTSYVGVTILTRARRIVGPLEHPYLNVNKVCASRTGCLTRNPDMNFRWDMKARLRQCGCNVRQ